MGRQNNPVSSLVKISTLCLKLLIQVGDVASEMPKPDPKNQFIAAAVVSGVATVSIGIHHRDR
jgi:hypothetical protein